MKKRSSLNLIAWKNYKGSHRRGRQGLGGCTALQTLEKFAKINFYRAEIDLNSGKIFIQNENFIEQPPQFYQPLRLLKVVKEEFNQFKRCLDASKLASYVDSTNCIIFHSLKNSLDETINIKVGKEPVRQDEYVTFPGLLLDKTLCWKHHFGEI